MLFCRVDSCDENYSYEKSCINLLTALELHVSNIYLMHKCIYIYCSRVCQLNCILFASHSRTQAFNFTELSIISTIISYQLDYFF